MNVVSWLRNRFGKQSSKFKADPNNDKVLLVRGWTEENVSRMLKDFGKMYENELPGSFRFELDARAPGEFIAVFPTDMPPDIFSYLINYAQYPMNLQPPPDMTAIGKTTLTDAFSAAPASEIGKQAVFYVPANDVEHDVVYVAIKDGPVFKNSFSSDEWVRVDDARFPGSPGAPASTA